MSKPITPIRNDADYEATLAEIEGLMDAAYGTEEGDRLDVLTTLVEAYEARHHRVDAPDAVEAIRYHMEARGLQQSDLAQLVGSKSRASEILNRRRALTLRQAWMLHRNWGLSAGCLMKPYALAAPAAGHKTVARGRSPS